MTNQTNVESRHSREPFDQLGFANAPNDTMTGTDGADALRGDAPTTADGLPGAIGFWSFANGANGNQAGTTHGQQRGTVIVESIWPNTAFEEGIGINTLTSAAPGYPNGGAVFHDTAVWVRGVN